MKALIVEDNPLTRLLYKCQLQSLGFDCLSCANAETALEAYCQTFYPLVLSDLELMDMNGVEFCRQIRALPRGKHSVILVLIRPNVPRDIQAAIEAGADDYLSKPITSDRLSERLEELMHWSRSRIQTAETAVY